jgi:hypothetical protein
LSYFFQLRTGTVEFFCLEEPRKEYRGFERCGRACLGDLGIDVKIILK